MTKTVKKKRLVVRKKREGGRAMYVAFIPSGATGLNTSGGLAFKVRG